MHRAERLWPATIATKCSPRRARRRGDLDIEGYLADIPYVATGGGNAYNEVHYDRPIRVGDDLVVEVMFTDVFEKSGRAGTLLFRTRTTRYLDLTRTGR
jgi:hypothetical protein